MRLIVTVVVSSAVVLLLGHSSESSTPPKLTGKLVPEGPAVLWREPADIAERNLFYGAGGESHKPTSDLTFLSEDNTGASPKFEAVDAEGVHWKVKLGIEARPETAVSRLVWSVGYFANEDYFVSEIHVNKLPHLRRGGEFVSKGGMVRNARLKRHSAGEKKLGIWAWAGNPFTGTREFNALRALMAVINDWDLKDINNAIYEVQGKSPEQHYLVSDLGASLGTTNLSRTLKGDLHSYEASNWILSTGPDHVDFNVPSAPPALWVFALPVMVRRMDMVWIGRGIPRVDAAWLGGMLGRLSPNQIRDAFRASGYSADEVERFSRVIERRIQELKRL